MRLGFDGRKRGCHDGEKLMLQMVNFWSRVLLRLSKIGDLAKRLAGV